MLNINKLKGAIREAGLTQEELATKLGLSLNALNRRINGKVAFNSDEMVELCLILNISDSETKCQIFLN